MADDQLNIIRTRRLGQLIASHSHVAREKRWLLVRV
jgi:hypothetical protein